MESLAPARNAIAEYVKHYPIGKGGQMVQVRIGARPPLTCRAFAGIGRAFCGVSLAATPSAGRGMAGETDGTAAGNVELAYTIELRSYLPLKPERVTAPLVLPTCALPGATMC